MSNPLLEGLKTFWAKITQQQSTTPEVISFMTIRRAVGWMAFILPIVLIAGGFIINQCPKVQPSISHYYYTNMREVFVGTLCAVALFLFSYKGYSQLDNWSASLAGFFCLTTALIPTDISCIYVDASCGQQCITYFPCQNPYTSKLLDIPGGSIWHLVSAASFLLILALMSIFLFTKSDTLPEAMEAPKKNRNKMYVICGCTMIVSLVCAGLYLKFVEKPYHPTQVVLALETLTLWAFGLSWLTKGEQIFPDKPSK